VGRPDLFPGQAVELAGKLYESLGKLKALPDHTLVLPAHGAGSLCGRAMGAMRFSAVGYEKLFNRELQHKGLDPFRASLLSGMPEAPDHFARCSDINRKGPAKLEELAAPRPLSAAEVHQWTQKGVVIIDGRDFLAFGGAHIPGAWSIDMAGSFQTFSGWVIPPEKPIVLVLESESRIHDAAAMLRRVGLDSISGWLEGGMHSWNVDGLPEEHVPQISAQELAAVLAKDSKSVLLDVRGKLEFETLHLNGALNIAAPDIRQRHPEVPRDRPVYVICNSGHRSSLACSILQQKGFRNVTNVVGGMMAFSAAGLVGTCPICSAPHLPAVQETQGNK
jgi:rhodanese-related sulfurtransferase